MTESQFNNDLYLLNNIQDLIQCPDTVPTHVQGRCHLKPKVYLRGLFRLETSQGVRIELRSAKAQGLVALLAASEKGERSRAWIMSKLWSDRGAEQASGSLRQTLTLLRRALKDTGVELEIDRRRISLNLNSVHVINEGQGEFLEGLDIRDDEFEGWLRVERAAKPDLVSAPMSASTKLHPDKKTWRLTIVSRPDGKDLEQWFEVLFADALSRSMKEIFAASVSVTPEPKPQDGQLIVRIQSFFLRTDELALRVTLEESEGGRRLWSGNRSVSTKGAPPVEHPELLRLVNELIEAVGDHISLIGGRVEDSSDPDSLYRMALWQLFSMRPEALVQADRHLERAFEIEKRGLYLAWRAQLRAIQSVERHPIDDSAFKEEGKQLCAKALELEPGNSMVLATVANALRRFDRDDPRSFAFAQRSVRLNPANPMAWWAMSAAASYASDITMSRDAAVVARRLVLLSPNRFWWDMQRFGPEMLEGNFDEAIRIAQLAHAGNPNFRPPLRYLVALYANKGMFEEAIVSAEKLKTLEPDFSVERLIGDVDYPASVIHRIPGLDLARLSEVK